MNNKLKYKDILSSPEYKKLLFTNLINRFGDSVDALSFTWLVYQITHSASWSALIFGLNMLPNIVLQPFLGALVEKLDKKKVIVFTHLLRGLIISAFVLMYLAGIVNPYIMVAFTLLITTIESFNMPASTAFIPSVIKKEHLTHAMSLNSSLSSTVTLIGTGLAGVIIAKFGVYVAMLIDASTFFIAAFGIATVKPLANEGDVISASTEKKDDKTTASNKESYIDLLKGGIKYIMGNGVILNYCLVAVILNALLVPLNSLQAPIAEDCYKLGSELLSVIGMAGAIGGIVGSAILPKISEKMTAKQILVFFGVLIGAGTYMVTLGKLFNGAAIPGYLLAGISAILITFSASIIGGMLSIEFMKTVDQKYLARAAAIFNASAAAASPVASLIVTFVATKVSADFLVATSGVLAIVLFILVAISNLKFEMKEESENAA